MIRHWRNRLLHKGNCVVTGERCHARYNSPVEIEFDNPDHDLPGDIAEFFEPPEPSRTRRRSTTSAS
jgi:hypothetical protein